VILKANANLKVYGVQIAKKATPLLCKTTDAGILSGSREEIKQEIADLSAKCWYQYAEGTITNLFKDPKDTRTCAICYYFKIDELQPEKVPAKTIMTESARTAYNISIPEFYNYVFTQAYNPGLVYGGGTKTSISDVYDGDFGFDLEIDPPRKIKLSDINSKPFDDYVVDYSGYMNQPSRETFLNGTRGYGDELLLAKKGRLLIIIADEFDNIDRESAANLITDLNLNRNKDTKDAILLLVDINNQRVRLSLGADLEPYINEASINSMLKDSFSKAPNLETAIYQLVGKIRTRLINEKKNKFLEKAGINLHSFYTYFANNGNYPLFLSDFKPGRTYAIAYASSTDERNYLAGYGEDTKAIINNVLGMKLFNPAGFNTRYTTFLVLVTGYFHQNPNNLIIARANDLNQYCKVMG